MIGYFLDVLLWSVSIYVFLGVIWEIKKENVVSSFNTFALIISWYPDPHIQVVNKHSDLDANKDKLKQS